MVDPWRLLEIRANKAPPLLEIFAIAKAHHMVINAAPADDEGIAVGLFDGPLELHGLATIGALKQRNGLLDASFELLLCSWLNRDLCNFKYHLSELSLGCMTMRFGKNRNLSA